MYNFFRKRYFKAFFVFEKECKEVLTNEAWWGRIESRYRKVAKSGEFYLAQNSNKDFITDLVLCAWSLTA